MLYVSIYIILDQDALKFVSNIRGTLMNVLNNPTSKKISYSFLFSVIISGCNLKQKFFIISTLLIVISCVTVPKAPKQSFDTITHLEIITFQEEHGNHDAYTLISYLRPNYLRIRGDKSPVIFLNDIYYGNLESLSGLSIRVIRFVKRIRPMDTKIRYGNQYKGGIIWIEY